MTSADDAVPVSRSERRFEIVATILLACAALATAWSGYQGSLWDGIQSSDYTQASAARTRAAQQLTEANQYRLADLSIFEGFVDASLNGNDELAAFYRERFRDEFEPAYEAWEAQAPLTNPAAPPTPLGTPEYELASEREAERLTARAEARFAAGEDANTYSDVYTASTLFFASALFFAAISERFAYVRARVSLLAISAGSLLVGFAVAVTQPVTFG